MRNPVGTIPNPTAVALITKGLTSGVMHPGNGKNQPAKLLMPLPGFRNLGLSPEQAAHFANEAGMPENDTAKIYAEALVNALETEGLELVPRTELEQLRAQVATPQEASPAAPSVELYCQHSNKALLNVALGRAKVPVDCDLLTKAITTAHEHD